MSKTTSITDDELIKDLKCCLLEDCERCKKDWSCVSQWDCMRNLMRHTLNFINRLKAIICDKNILIDCLKNKINRQKAEIERLEDSNKRLKEAVGLMLNNDNGVELIKSEAIKEFAERLKNSETGKRFLMVNFNDIDNLVKEMTEGGNEDG